MRVRVQNGTNAGCKPPLRERPRDWFCRCVVVGFDIAADGVSGTAEVWKKQRGYLARCPDCGTVRGE